MLVLSRRKGEVIRVYTTDGIIEIQVCENTDHHTKLGITAPRNVTILREELDIPKHSASPS